MRVGVFGATGQVGQVMRTLLAERNFPVDSIRYFSSAKSAGKTLPWKGVDVVVEGGEGAAVSDEGAVADADAAGVLEAAALNRPGVSGDSLV